MRRNLRTPFLVASALVVAVTAQLSTANAQDAAEDTVGVAVAVAVNVSELEADLLSDDLGWALGQKFQVTVVSGEAARAKLPSDGLPETCIAETECLGQTAAALGVKKLLLLVAVRVGSDIQVDATLYDAATKASDNRPTVKMTDKRSQWRESFSEAAATLLPGAKAREEGTGTGTGGTGTGGTGTGGTGTGTGPIGPSDGGSNLHLVLFGAAAASFAIGAGAGLSALARCDWEFGEVCDGDPVVREAVFDVGMGVGVALSVAAIVVMLKGDGDSGERSALQLQSGPGDVGFAIGGSF